MQKPGGSVGKLCGTTKKRQKLFSEISSCKQTISSASAKWKRFGRGDDTWLLVDSKSGKNVYMMCLNYLLTND